MLAGLYANGVLIGRGEMSPGHPITLYLIECADEGIWTVDGNLKFQAK